MMVLLAYLKVVVYNGLGYERHTQQTTNVQEAKSSVNSLIALQHHEYAKRLSDSISW